MTSVFSTQGSLFITENGMKPGKADGRTKLELKYCECCGGLWLRLEGEDEGRCDTCVRMSTDWAGAWARRIKQRSRREPDAGGAAVAMSLGHGGQA